jgi:hypothetical protein
MIQLQYEQKHGKVGRPLQSPLSRGTCTATGKPKQLAFAVKHGVTQHMHVTHGVCAWVGVGRSPMGAQAPVTGPHWPLLRQVAEGTPAKPALQVAMHWVPIALVEPQAKAPFAGLGGLPVH